MKLYPHIVINAFPFGVFENAERVIAVDIHISEQTFDISSCSRRASVLRKSFCRIVSEGAFFVVKINGSGYFDFHNFVEIFM